MECPVCYKDDNIKFLNCSHYLCNKCFKNLYQKECPLCRAPINQNLFKYNPPLHKPSKKILKLKDKFELFFRRRNFLAGGGLSKKYRKFLFYMLKYGNVYYFKGQYYNVNCEFGYWDYCGTSGSMIKLLNFYKFLLTSEKYLIPSQVKDKLIDNIEKTFIYLDC